MCKAGGRNIPAACSDPSPRRLLSGERRGRATATSVLSSSDTRGCAQELRSLFLFSFLFSLSTRFLFIFSASFAYLSFSSLAARFSLSRVIRACTSKNQYRSVRTTTSPSRSRRLWLRCLSAWLFVARTCLSASFSSFISFSLALTAASAILSFARFSYEVSPDPGRNAFLGMCHCLPACPWAVKCQHSSLLSWTPALLDGSSPRRARTILPHAKRLVGRRGGRGRGCGCCLACAGVTDGRCCRAHRLWEASGTLEIGRVPGFDRVGQSLQSERVGGAPADARWRFGVVEEGRW